MKQIVLHTNAIIGDKNNTLSTNTTTNKQDKMGIEL
jgi:hypothetical protein